jgi:hypothetical protein
MPSNHAPKHALVEVVAVAHSEQQAVAHYPRKS